MMALALWPLLLAEGLRQEATAAPSRPTAASRTASRRHWPLEQATLAGGRCTGQHRLPRVGVASAFAGAASAGVVEASEGEVDASVDAADASVEAVDATEAAAGS